MSTLTPTDLAPKYGPYTFGTSTLNSGDKGGSSSLNQSDSTVRLPAPGTDRPATSLRSPAPAGMPQMPDLSSLEALFRQAAGGQQGGNFDISGGGDSSGGGGMGVPSGASSPNLGQMQSGAQGKGLPGGLFSNTVMSLLPMLVPQLTLPMAIAKIAQMGRNFVTNPLNNNLSQAQPRASSPPPEGGSQSAGTPSVPGDTTVSPQAAQEASQIANQITLEGLGFNFGRGQDVAVNQGRGDEGDAGSDGGPGTGGTGSGTGTGAGDASAGGEGSTSGDASHAGRKIPGKPSTKDTITARVAKGEWIINSKASKLHDNLLKAINSGATKADLRKLIDKGR